MNDKLKSLYDNLVSGGYELPDFDTFSKDMGDSAKANKLYSTMIEDGYELPDNFDSFYQDITPAKEAGVMDYVQTGMAQANRGFYGGFNSLIQGGGAVQRRLFSALGYPEDAPLPIVPGMPNLEQTGQELQSAIESANPVNEN